MSDLPARLAEIVDDFSYLEGREKLEYLLELESKEVFEKLKNITPISTISLNKPCGK